MAKLVIIIDNEKLKRIRKWADNIDLKQYLVKKLTELDPKTYTVNMDIPGVPVRCTRCGHQWIYRGSNPIVKCHKCGKKVSTHIRAKMDDYDAYRVEGK